MGSDAKHRPVYVISVAAELVDMHPQTLRLYERKGLIRPGRSSGKTRLYSERDIEHLREIRRLTQELGVNLAGVEEIMRLRQKLEGARSRMEGNVQRIQQDITERMTQWRELPAASAAEFVADSFARARYAHTARLEIGAPAEVVRARDFGTRLGRVEELGPDRCRLTVSAQDPVLVVQHVALVAALGVPYEVEADVEVTRRLRDLGRVLGGA